MSEEAELKPCPFCGGEAMFDVKSNKSTHYGVGFYFGIICNNCKLILPQTFKAEFCMTEQGEINTIADERKEAIETWNRRVDNVPISQHDKETEPQSMSRLIAPVAVQKWSKGDKQE